MMAALSVGERPEREPVHCDCCGDEVVAERVGDRVVIRQRRHGRVHTGVVILSVPVEVDSTRSVGAS